MFKVEKHKIKQSSKYYKLLDDMCFKSKSLYNHANYVIRQEFIKNRKYLNFYDMDKLAKGEDYKQIPAKSSQYTLKMLDRNWKSFFASIKDYNINPSKYTGRPKLPKYLDKKNGKFILGLTNQQCKISEGIIKFPKVFNGMTIKTKVSKLQEVRIIPRNKQIIIEVVYDVGEFKEKKNNNKILGLDVGIDNLLAVSNNFGAKSFLINGKNLKSINQFYNKKLAEMTSDLKQVNNKYTSNRIYKLTNKRNDKINDYLHKVSKFIVSYACDLEVTTIVIGNNKDWKRECKLSKKVNQSFVNIPHQRLIEMIQYKAYCKGIKVILTEEGYTSGTSFVDKELPIKENYNKSRRFKRGLFKSNKGIIINSDINGSCQIIKKVFSNAFSHEIEGLVLNPIKVTIN